MNQLYSLIKIQLVYKVPGFSRYFFFRSLFYVLAVSAYAEGLTYDNPGDVFSGSPSVSSATCFQCWDTAGERSEDISGI